MLDPTAKVDAYVRDKQLALGRAIAPRAKIYLDLNFWIAARDAAQGIRTDPPARKLLHLLRRGVGQGRLICPVGDTSFMELIKQPLSEDRRLGTARIVDDLSLGVSILPSRPRTGTEIYRLLHQALGQADTLTPMQNMVWTKVCHILGPSYPFDDAIDAETMVVLQKRTIDTLWKAPLIDMILRAGDDSGEHEDFGPLTEDANRQRDLYADEITSYQVAYDAELRGAIDAFGDLTADILLEIGARAGLGEPSEKGDRALIRNGARNALYQAFKAPGAASTVRTLHVETALHASLRFDKKRRMKPNDWHDFRHAAAALAYCDVFLTDGPLHDLVKRPQLGLLQVNGCQVASTLDDAIAILRALP